MNNIYKLRSFCLTALLLIATAALRAQGSGWAVNPYDYQYDMTVYAQLNVDGQTVTDFTGYEVGAFVGDECRAVGEVCTQNGLTWLYLRVRSNKASGETVDFRVYNAGKGRSYGIAESVAFQSQGLVGMPSTPFALTCRMATCRISATSANEAMGTVTLTGGGEEVEYGATVTADATPREGHSFAGWTADGTTVSTDNPYTFKATDNIALVGNFKVNQYSVTFVVDGVETTTLQDYGSPIIAPDAPEKEGYTFRGWTPDVPATVPAGNVTFTAVYTVNQYKLTYYVNGTAVYSLDLDYGAAIEAYTPELGDTLQFEGWTTEIPATMPAHDVDIHGTASIVTSVMRLMAGQGGAAGAYTLSGRLVARRTNGTTLRQLPDGIYIIGGKKHVIRHAR